MTTLSYLIMFWLFSSLNFSYYLRRLWETTYKKFPALKYFNINTSI